MAKVLSKSIDKNGVSCIDLLSSHIYLEDKESVACWRQLQKELHRLRGRNVIVSDERLSSEAHLHGEGMIGKHADGLLQHWRVIVVVGYQRYSEWILSFQNNRGDDEQRLLTADTKWPEDTRLHTLSNSLYM
jgi:hypothetical protein